MKFARKYYYSTLGLQHLSRFSSSLPEGKQHVSDKLTVDYKNIDIITNLGSKWWDLNGPLKGLHSMNAVRIEFIKTSVLNSGFKVINPQKPLEGIKLLDVGCGGGILSEPLAKMGAQVTGIDISKELLAIAEEHAAAGNLNRSNLIYKNVSIEDLSQEKKNHYDVVVASEILEHVDNQSVFLRRCSEVLKPNGFMFITTLNRTLLSWLSAIVALEYILRLVPIGLHEWDKFITPDETARLLDKYNCKTKSVQGFFFNPLTNKWSSISSTATFYALHAVKQENKQSICQK